MAMTKFPPLGMDAEKAIFKALRDFGYATLDLATVQDAVEHLRCGNHWTTFRAPIIAKMVEGMILEAQARSNQV